VIGAFGYLVARSARNRVVRQLRHLRSPRYVAALLLGLAYIWVIAVEQRPAPAPATAAMARVVELAGSLAVLGAVAWSWAFGVERRVLAFTPAEVTFLFPGPVSRRGLIQFKLLRTQLVILLNVLLWTLILSREPFGVSHWLRAVSIWVLLTTLSLHRLGASFVRNSLLEHGRIGLRHRVVALSVLAAVAGGLGWGVVEALPAITAGWNGGIARFLIALGEAGARPVVHAMLSPFRLIVRPLAAATTADWLASIGPAAVMLLLHYVWVIRSDTAFEEAAAETSLRRAQRLAERRSGSPDRAPRSVWHTSPPLMRLAPTGWPGGAILWKNVVAVTRARRLRSTTVALLVVAAAVTALSLGPGAAMAEIAGWLAAMWAGFMLVVGPQWVRNDLRGDLLKLDLLRSYPLPGATVVAAEAAASTLILTLIQLALLLVAFLAFVGNDTLEPDLRQRALLLGAAVLCLPGVNFAGMLIQNGAAILYPAWVHLGSGRPGGIEALGQNMLMLVAFVALLAAVLLPAAVIGGGAYLLLRPAIAGWAVGPGMVLGLAALAFECALIVNWLGGVFERTEPAEIQ